MGCITVVLIKMIFWALCKVIMDFALHTPHNQHRSISDHIYNVNNTHDNITPHLPSEDKDRLRHPPNGTRAFAVHVKSLTPRVSNETKSMTLIIYCRRFKSEIYANKAMSILCGCCYFIAFLERI